MITTLIVLGLIWLAFWVVARFYLSGEDLSRFDGGSVAIGSGVDGQREPSAEHHDAVALLASMGEQNSGSGNRLQQIRDGMDAMGEAADLTGITIKPVSVDGVPGEWVLAENADPSRRTALRSGTPSSHRAAAP